MFPGTKNRNEGTCGCSPEQNRNEGIFAKTALLQNRPFVANPFPPLQPSKTPETPNLSKICPSNCFGGFQSGGLKFEKICRNLKNGNFRTNFDKFFQISVPPDWNPPKQLLGQILDKFGVSGVFEGCKGEKGFATLLFPLDFGVTL